MTISSKTLPSLIQGISQQGDIARGSASAEDQMNCLNEVLDGVISRMGSVYKASISAVYNDPFVHEIIRENTEEYIVLVEAGTLKIINRATGTEASITGNISSYLSHTGLARHAFQAVTVGDTTFLLNRQKVTQMSPTLSPARPHKAIAHVRAGAYATTYTLRIVWGSQTFTTAIATPDNSVPENAAYITTQNIAEQIRAALVATTFPAIIAAGGPAMTVRMEGSTLIIAAPHSNWDLYTEDGMGDTQFISFKDHVKSLEDLPAKAESGYVVSVSGNGAAESEKFYLQFQGGVSTGRWVEIVAPSTKTAIDPSTMPHLLVNTGLNTFEVKQASWGARLAGDGIYTAKDPSFIGKTIKSLQFISGRLSASTEYTMVLSRSRNAYVFFPDTVQTKLDTAPVDYDVSNGSSTSIRHAVVVGGSLQFWGDEQQTFLDSGQDPIREDTTEVLGLSNYVYDGEVAPQPIGLRSLLFGTTSGRWAKLTEVFLRNGRGDGEIEITAHVPRLLDGKIRRIAAGQASSKAFVLTENRPLLAYLYQWYNQGSDRVQSAWNPWSFTAPEKILWCSIRGSIAWFLLKWPTGVTLEAVTLDAQGDETSERLPIRLDHRLNETYGSHDGEGFVMALPYAVPPQRRGLFIAVEREDIPDVAQRGRNLQLAWLSDTSVKVLVDDPSRKFFFGAVPEARRKFSRFYAKDRDDQAIIHGKLLLKKVDISHSDTVQYDVVIRKADGTTSVQTYESRVLGDPSITNRDVPMKTDNFKADIGEETENVEIELVNNTPFPAIWTAAKFTYDLTTRDS
jgi:hypothetical protein